MIVSFKNVDWTEQPTLVLKNLDGTFLQPLTKAFNIEAKLNYNETSELHFDLPAIADGEATSHYDDVVGMKLIDWVGVGQFVLVNPSISNDGIREVKECKAYSLEYELTYKSTYISEGTYEFWNPMAPDSTVLGMIVEDYPSWSVGTVDDDLVGRYRTFESDNQKTYDLMKNTLQEKYQCIFDFDTYDRKINVRSVAVQTRERPVYLSMDNLIKDIEIEEDTENIFTALDVNGADGVDIRSVNPLGTNTIYNLDYFMTASNFSQKMINQWNEWKTVYENAQKQYYDITVEKVLEESALATANAVLVELKNELSTYETLQATYIEAAAQGIDRAQQLAEIKVKIEQQEAKISAKEEAIASMQGAIGAALDRQKEINAACAFSNFFTNAELTVLDRYIKKDSISEESFVYNKVDSYADADTGAIVPDITFRLTDAQISGTTLESGRAVYSCIGGNIEIRVGSITVTAKVVRSALERNPDGSYIYSAYLNKGSYDTVDFESAGISATGEACSLNTDVSQSTDVGGDSYIEGTYFESQCGESSFYFTRNCSEYQKRSIEWDLMEFGEQELNDLCWPSYTFSVDVGNFLALEDFTAFKNQFALGDKVYVDTGKQVLKPIAVSVEINFENLADFKLLFGDRYSLRDSAFRLVDLLEESIKVGKTTASSRVSYSSFVNSGAATYVKEFMDSAINAAKNAVLAGANQEIEIKESGVRLRSYDADTDTYGDEQIWMINNVIAFTDDGWSSAKMALGKIFDNDLERYEKTTDSARDETKTYYTDTDGTIWNPNGETEWSTSLYERTHEGSAYGIAAPYLVGKVLAGENLIIESTKKDGGVAVFRVDSEGARLYNSRFDLVRDSTTSGTNATGIISLNPGLGFVGGKDTVGHPVFGYDDNGDLVVVTEGGNHKANLEIVNKDDLPNASFWIDMLGNAYFKGTIYATDGEFSGELKAASGTFSGTVKAAKFEGAAQDGSELIGPAIYVPTKDNYKFSVDATGKVTIRGGNISFDSLDAETQKAINDAVEDAEDAQETVEGWTYSGSTYIDGSKIMTGTVMASKLLGGSVELLDAKQSSLGSISIALTEDGYGLGFTTTDGGIKIISAGNLFLKADSGANITLNGASGIVLGGAPVFFPSECYGSTLPSTGQAGQVYFKYV